VFHTQIGPELSSVAGDLEDGSYFSPTTPSF